MQLNHTVYDTAKNITIKRNYEGNKNFIDEEEEIISKYEILYSSSSCLDKSFGKICFLKIINANPLLKNLGKY